jgi:hypothetical protein
MSTFKKIVFTILLISFSSAVYSQIIKGIVFDQSTKSPITFATVYFNGTYVGTYTDDKGSFKLDNSKISSMPLTVSAIGYYSITISDFSADKDVLVYLTPKVFEINEVFVNAKYTSKIRIQNLELFRREFLGRTSNAKECEITNEDDIKFTTSKNNDTLKAFSSKPIYIINKALGYRVTYYMNKFELYKPALYVNLVGNILFEEDTTTNKNTENYENNRLRTYLGSKMHFIRSLWQNKLVEEGFKVVNNKRKFTANDLVTQKIGVDNRSRKYLNYPGKLPVKLDIKWLPGKVESNIDIETWYIFIDETGYFNGSGLVWYGEMAKQNIADWLPFEYLPDKTNIKK